MNEKIIDFEAHRLQKNRDKVKDKIENALWEMAEQVAYTDFDVDRLWEITRQTIRKELISLNGKLSAESGMPEFKHLTEEDIDKYIQDFEEHTPKPWDDPE